MTGARSGPRSIAPGTLIAFALLLLVPAWIAPLCQDDDKNEAPARLSAMADFNRDGIPDVATAMVLRGASDPAAYLTVALGQPDGSYKTVSSTPIPGSVPKSVIVGDFNGDGFPDVVVGDQDGAVLLLAGDGAGRMGSAAEIAHLDSVVSLATADFNHDNIPDLAVSDWHASKIILLLGNGNGSFHQESSFPLRMPGTAPRISAADFDGDGNADLAVVYGDDGDYTFDVMLGDGKGNFVRSAKLSFVKDPNSHCVT